jgi:hypothetical protein
MQLYSCIANFVILMVMRHILIFLICLGGAILCQAQTRKIAHRSHSGQPVTFAFLMEDDHAGAYNPPPEDFDLEPWVAKIKKHYEDQAKKTANEDKKAEASLKTAPVLQPVDSLTPSTQPAPTNPNEQPHPSKRKGKARNAEVGEQNDAPQITEVTPFPLAKKAAHTQLGDASSPSAMGLWILVGVLVLTVGPGVYWITGRKA